jgi:hypothetical protein
MLFFSLKVAAFLLLSMVAFVSGTVYGPQEGFKETSLRFII